MTDLVGKVAIVTGGSRGIGAAAAAALAGAGASVMVVARDGTAAFRVPDAILASQADSRMNCRSGLAGAPAQRSPAGTSCMTPAAAAIWAPAPMVR